ncbi:MAG: hypothetical protein AAGG75_04590, partial [Bacteroidota bacterium]
KLSYHKGERRWVGKNDSTYLQIFFQDLADHEEMYFAVGKHQDLEKMYRTKYNEMDFSKYEKQ